MTLDQELIYVVMIGDYSQFLGLIKRGANINTRDEFGRTPLMISAIRGDEIACDIFLSRGAKIGCKDIDGHTALHFFDFTGNQLICRKLILFGAAINMKAKNGYTPIQAAAASGHFQTCFELLELGAVYESPHAYDEYNKSKYLACDAAICAYLAKKQALRATDQGLHKKNESALRSHKLRVFE